MSGRYQHECPAARVNITLNVETHNASEHHELPMKLLVIGHFYPVSPAIALAKRPRHKVTCDNIDSVLASVQPHAKFSAQLTPQSSISVSLHFTSMQSFHPDAIALQVPEIRNWIAMRKVLTDLKACILDNPNFRQQLATILQQPKLRQQLLQQLQENASISNFSSSSEGTSS